MIIRALVVDDELPMCDELRCVLTATGTIEVGVNEVLVIGHLDCGMAHVTSSELIAKMRDRGISQDAISMVDDELKVWLGLFHHPVENVRHVVSKIRSNPLIPCDVPIHGLMFDPHSGEIEVIVNGYGQSL